MTKVSSDVAFSPAVKAVQQRLGSRRAYARLEEKGGWRTALSDDVAAFIADRDSFYLATASAEGQPYIQHRGGPKGFLKVLNETSLAFADFGGNKQYITIGNLSENDRAQVFLMDYAGRQRVKIWGHARVVEDHADLLARLADPAYAAKVERAILFEISAIDINCPQHITPRYGEDIIAEAMAKLQARIEALEAENAQLRALAGNDSRR